MWRKSNTRRRVVPTERRPLTEVGLTEGMRTTTWSLVGVAGVLSKPGSAGSRTRMWYAWQPIWKSPSCMDSVSEDLRRGRNHEEAPEKGAMFTDARSCRHWALCLPSPLLALIYNIDCTSHTTRECAPHYHTFTIQYLTRNINNVSRFFVNIKP